jgi:uncharacterized membrane protein
MEWKLQIVGLLLGFLFQTVTITIHVTARFSELETKMTEYRVHQEHLKDAVDDLKKKL